MTTTHEHRQMIHFDQWKFHGRPAELEIWKENNLNLHSGDVEAVWQVLSRPGGAVEPNFDVIL